MPAANRHLPVVETRRLPHYIRFTAPRDYPSAHEPSATDRRLTSFYRADTARETQCWQWNQWFQGQTKLSQKYVSPPSEKSSRESFLHPSIPLNTGWRATVFYRTPSTKEEKTRLGRWTSTCVSLYRILSICQTNWCTVLKTVSRLLQQTAHFFLSCRYSTRGIMLAIVFYRDVYLGENA